MTLSIQYKSIEINDESQTNPVNVVVRVAAMTDQGDVANVRGNGEVQRVDLVCTTTRANVAAFLQTCTVQNKAQIPAAVLALVSPPLTVP